VNAQALARNEEGIEFGFKRTALHRAAWHGHAKIVSLLIEEFKANPNLQTSRQDHCVTPLHEAIDQEKDAAVTALLKCAQLNVEIQDARGRTALHHAILMGKTEYIARIIGHQSYKKGKKPSDPNSIESLLSVKPLNHAERIEELLKGFMASSLH
jgi:ankyrin repeat protein